MNKNILVMSLLVFVLGCDGFESQVQSDLVSLNNGSGEKTFLNTNRPACEVSDVDYELDTHVLAFEMVDRGGLAVGFDLLSGFLQGINLGFKIERAKMLASMHMSESLRPNETIADVTGRGTSTKTEFKVGVDFGQLGVDLDYYRQTPLNKLTEKTTKDSLKNLRKELDQTESQWRTRALYIYNDIGQLIIPAGSVAGVREGDLFSIYNVEYVWEGEPCASTLVFERKTTKTPIALVRVYDVYPNSSALEILERGHDEAILVGALLEIEHLPLAKKEKSRTLKRSVRLRSVQSEELLIPEAKNVDISLYVREQVQAQLSEYKLYPRK